MDNRTPVHFTTSCKPAEHYCEVSIQLFERQRQFELAKGIAQEEVTRRLEANSVPSFVRTFLEGHWQDLLALVHFQHGGQDEVWYEYLGTVDELVWSCSPIDSRQGRSRLGALLPDLVRRLKKGMQLLGLDPCVGTQVLQRLAYLHAGQVCGDRGHWQVGGVSNMRAVATPPRTVNPAASIAGQENEAPTMADDVLEWHTARLGELQDAYYNSPKAPLEAENAGQGTHSIDVEEPWSVTDKCWIDLKRRG